ncbi:SAM-dependent methyltransferase [Desulfocurvibacter africanus PCS]|uniref:SAM-dependent methyltransferase n=1 Tax=Desulfocurvibacter africanus PCS TaxID=1262666 RepID=M5Q2E0_DESAF|nr:class I SAM-dependent rRNA methyltransferase [Desulfocurvibacter africanus]EMG37343.1 SAM-dependent methyltransferase [Desulfocurvibacter africanus PCS]
MNTLYLKKNEDRRIRAGHLWIFSNEVDTARSPIKSFSPGEETRVVDSAGGFVAMAYVNPTPLIFGRVYSRSSGDRLDAELLAKRLGQALELREKLFDTPHYRLAFGEGDYLPGLVIDRYGDLLVAQLTTAGMDSRRKALAEALRATVRNARIVFKNDSSARELEGLPLSVEALEGDVPEEAELAESGAKFVTPLAGGQKTGWFYDMRPNRQRLAGLATGGRVLDVFSYVGGLGVLAAVRGASEAICLDSSETALKYAARNAELNGVADKVRTERGDAFDVLARLHDAGERFDAVSVDPPAFIKRKKDHPQGMQAYMNINRLAMRLVRDGGWLLSASCSQHLSRDDLRSVLGRAASKAGVRAQIVEQGHQGPDHPVHPAMPETDYLKSYLVRVLR